MRIKDKKVGVKPTRYATSPGKLCVMSRFDPGFSLGSTVHAAHPEVDYRGPVEKMAINLTYDKYKFFTVETDARIIK
jgi:hypothetical protein